MTIKSCLFNMGPSDIPALYELFVNLARLQLDNFVNLNSNNLNIELIVNFLV